MPKSLSHLVNEVPPTFPQSVPDSCDEESSDEETAPKPLSGSTPGGGLPSNVYRTPGSLAHAGPSRVALNSLHRQKHGDDVRVKATIGRSGKTVYQATKTGTQPTSYFTVQWRKPQTKKHKTWDGDAVLRIESNRIIMTSEDGDHMATSALIGGLPGPGSEMRIGNYEVEVDREIDNTEYKQTTSILNKPQPKAVPIAYAPSTYVKAFRPPTQAHAPRPIGGPIKATPNAGVPGRAISVEDTPTAGPSRKNDISSTTGYKTIRAESFYGSTKPKPKNIVIGEKSNKQRMEWGGALHDPKAEGAVVMKRPDEKAAKKRGVDIVDVVLDPFLASKMREHQKEGVKFMYANVMGLTGAEAEGCILADEMGLGKTLQTIGLIYTLLKQSPFSDQVSVIGKALVVCPVSLVENWKKEFRKWIPNNLLTAVAADGADHVVKSFVHHRGQHVLIIGYERLRKVIGQLASCQPPIDLIVCDEGHRLKTKDNKTTKMFNQLRTQRRIILSGTPVQNDLSEYHAMVDFTCPGLLGTYKQFLKQYEAPITKSRNPNCTGQALEDGRLRAEELGLLSKEFVLRRTADVLENYLPPKHEYVVFVAPSVHQIKAFSRVLTPDQAQRILGEQDKLSYINILRKISNSPMLLRSPKNAGDDTAHMAKSALTDIPGDMNTYDVTASGKLLALDKMLHAIHATTREKVVIVSNFTSTLDMIQEVCKKKRYPYLRLDGSTAQKQRIESVDLFNRQRREESFVFLLSAKAGGVGINLIGASRLILFDSDWNPSTDLQAMARIHRDGQKKPVYIYRLLTTNTIDEKIYQRQITKTGLANQMMDHDAVQEKTRDSFTKDELRDMFQVHYHTNGCQTHDLLSCECITKAPVVKSTPPSSSVASDDDNTQSGFVPASQANPEPTAKMLKKAAVAQREKLAELKHWTHMDGFSKTSFAKVADTILYNLIYDSWEEKESMTTTTPSAATSIAGANEDDNNDVDDVSDENQMGLDSDVELDLVPSKKRTKRNDSGERNGQDTASDDEFDDKLEKGGRQGKKSNDLFSLFSDDDNDEEVTVPKKRTRRSEESDRSRSTSSRAVSAKNKGKGRAMVSPTNGEKKHDLRKIAANGGVGRIMFVFEKVSASKL